MREALPSGGASRYAAALCAIERRSCCSIVSSDQRGCPLGRTRSGGGNFPSSFQRSTVRSDTEYLSVKFTIEGYRFALSCSISGPSRRCLDLPPRPFACLRNVVLKPRLSTGHAGAFTAAWRSVAHPSEKPSAGCRDMNQYAIADAGIRQAARLIQPPTDRSGVSADLFRKRLKIDVVV
jgi:hypothetical protein